MKQTTKKDTISRVELLLVSVIKDNYGVSWIKTILLNSDNENVLNLIVNSVNKVNKQPFLFLYAKNKLLKKYYSMLTKARFYRIQIDLVKFAEHKHPNIRTGEPGEILGETYENEPEITIIPNK